MVSGDPHYRQHLGDWVLKSSIFWSAQEVAQCLLDFRLLNPLKPMYLKGYSRVRNFLHTTAQEVAHFFQIFLSSMAKRSRSIH
jgi:hypothetical protein